MLENCSSIVSHYKENCTLSSPFSFKDTSFWRQKDERPVSWLQHYYFITYYVFITYESKMAQNKQYFYNFGMTKMFNAKTKRFWTEAVQRAVEVSPRSKFETNLTAEDNPLK